MKTSKVVREIANEIENVFRNNELAEPNPLALAQLEVLHSRMRLHCGYCFERTTKIISLAKDFYSVRKHQLHPGGADGVLRDVCVNLEEMRAWASLWEKNGK
ncbi:hypothetical protein [Burkholderia multivorans]|uniref:hypothetical protein n=1 Tax=Burkholderia multivorans TaxID=87883 RepID=UPI00215716AA|nr:hypothetical protein [Burkholderia multivorans]